MNVLIVGCGRIGARLAQQLDQEGHKVTVVDERVAAFDRLSGDFKGEMVVGTGIDESVLRRAGIESADCFASVTNGDNRNIMAAQIAKRIFNVPCVITRIYDPIRENVYRGLGLETFCPTSLGAGLIHDYFVKSGHGAPTPAPDGDNVEARA